MHVSLNDQPNQTAKSRRRGRAAGGNGASISPSFSREGQLLLSCARTQIDVDTAERIHASAGQAVDWPHLIESADRHGVLPLLYSSLQATCAHVVPKDVLAELRDRFHDNIVRNYAFASELCEIVELFEAHGIEVLALKGPALAVSAYRDLSLRQFGDLDLLVREHDLAAAGDLLRSHGYAPECSRTRAQETGVRQMLHDLQFEGEDHRPPVELHWRLADWTRPLAFPLDRMWKTSVRIPLLKGGTIRSIAPEELLLYLCLHGSVHQWERLCWICDVAELIRVDPELDWESTLEQAKQMGCERQLYLGLVLARDLLGARLPGRIGQQAQADPQISALAHQVCRSLLSERPNSRFSEHLFQQQVTAGSWRERVQLGWRRVLFRVGIRWALEPPDGPFAALYPLLERVPSGNVWIWPLPLYALLFLVSHPLYPIRQALERASARESIAR